MDEGRGWFRAHWRTAAILVLIFGLSLFLRLFFVYGLAFPPPAVNCDSIYTPKVSGGSDSYYWDRALCYSFRSGRDLGADPMLDYPLGNQNPRPPLFPWFSLLVGQLIAPLFATPWQGVSFVFLLSSGLFGALTVFPTYALAKEAFGRKAGVIGALLLALSVGHLQRSQSTDADHDAFTLFFVVSTFYFFLRSLRTLNRRRWVENWFRKDSILAGVRGFFKENRTSVLYAFFAGLSVTVIALAWQGWAYVSVILLVWFAVELFLGRFRNEDTMGTWILFTIALTTPLILAFQWYLVRVQIRVWYDVPAYLFLAAFVLGLAFTVTRDYPWTLVIPSTLIAGAVGLAVGVVVSPALTSAFFTGAGYFVQTKVVTTIAEDQAPGMSQMILAFGLFTFGLSLVAIAYLLWQVPRRHDPAYNIVVIWAFVAIFMAITAARFIFNASPAFAVVGGFAVAEVLRRADFVTMRRTYRSLATGSWRNALRKSLKVRHVLAILGIVFLVLLPNVWWAVDASIPFELKTQYDRQVASLLPAVLRAPGYNPSSSSPYYFGAFGYSLPKDTEYYPAAWRWFATQDADRPAELRPAFLSWWDYGFEAVDRGVHPTVADNFQNGYAIAGQFITAQNETSAISLLVIRLLEGDFRLHRPHFGPGVTAALVGAGLQVDVFESVFLHPADYISIVQSDPVRYGVWAADMQASNAVYVFLTTLIAQHLDANAVASLYHAVRDATGWDIGYFAVDSRLFPIGVQNTGIFYAPVKLSDHRVIQLPDGRVLPVDFFQILGTTATSTTPVPIQNLPPSAQVQSTTIRYLPAFYKSMFYRSYIGYSPADVGLPNETGIPGFTQALQSFPPAPAWNLTHFRVVYRTAYYNPFPDPGNHTDAYQAMNYDQARSLQENITAGKAKGFVDLSTISSVGNGVVFLRYYDGAWVNGTVTAGSNPLPGVRITVTDELGTPHYLTTTDANGHYSALVPFGDVTITASIGTATRTTLVGSRTLSSTTLHVSVDQAMRSPADLDGDGLPDWIMTRDLQVPPHAIQGTAYYDLDHNGAFGPGDVRAGRATIGLSHKEFSFRPTTTAALDGTFSIPDVPAGTYAVKIGLEGRNLSGNDISIAGTDAPQDVAVPFALVHGTTSSPDGPVTSADVVFRDETNGTLISSASQADGSYRVGPLLAGNYTVAASAGDFASAPERIRTGPTDLALNLTLLPSGTVTGTTNLFGNARPFATLEFQSAVDTRTIRTVTSDGNAQYSIRLAAGEWFASGRFYDGTTLYATLGRVVVAPGGTATFNPMFVDGVRVEGRVLDPNPTVQNPQADVAFRSGAGQLWLRAETGGRYLAFLPKGTYDLEAFNRAGASFASVGFSSNARRDIDLIGSSESVAWRVYRDVNGDGTANSGEEIPGAYIDLVDDQGARLFLTTPASGDLPVPMFANRSYSGTVTAGGFGARSISASAPAGLRALVPIALSPIPVQVSGTVLLGGSPLVNRPVTIRAVPAGDGAVAASSLSDSNGGYVLALVPGRYDLVVDENVSTSADLRYQNLVSDRISLAVGQASLAYDLRIVQRSRVHGNVTLSGSAVAATVSFDGPEHRTVEATAAGYEIYLVAGGYIAAANRTISSSDYAFVAGATVPAASTVNFALSNATRATGHVLFQSVAIPGPMSITFLRQGGGTVLVSTDVGGSYSAILATGNYSVSLNGTASVTENGAPRFYRYTFSGTVAVSAGASVLPFDLNAVRTLDNTTVTGVTTQSGQGVDAQITFTARGEGAITAQATSDSNGLYSVTLAPGTYDVYARRSFGSVAFFARITVAHMASFARDVPLSAAFLLSGVVSDPLGGPASASIAIASSAQLDLTSGSDGRFQALLPQDGYGITATKAVTENGISVTYRGATSLTLDTDSSVAISLAKVVSRSVTMSWDSSQRREIAAGDSVVYTIVVGNTGNVADTFRLDGTPADWQFTFSPSSLSLNFGSGATSVPVQVVIVSPTNALVSHPSLRIVATSTTDASTAGDVTVNVDITRVRGLSVGLDSTTAAFDGRFLNYTLHVKNEGNARETVQVEVTNPNELAAVGWTLSLGGASGPLDGTLLRNVTVDANQTATVRLQAASTSGSSGATVVLVASAQDSPAVSANTVFTLDLPDLAPGTVTVTGPDITRAAPLNTPLVAVAIGAAAAIAVGVYLTRKRR